MEEGGTPKRRKSGRPDDGLRLIFLDVDGVLNRNKDGGSLPLVPELMQNLNKIVTVSMHWAFLNISQP
jgi:hypothetical protein